MKLLRLLLFISLSNNSFAQVTFGSQYVIDVYKPYTPEAQSYIKVNNKVSSQTQNAYLYVKLLKRGKLNWQGGICYKRIFHRVEDKIKTYYWMSYGNGMTSQSHWVQENYDLDLWSKSHSLGLMNEISWTLKERERISHEVGFSNETYFFEFFHSAYYLNGVLAEKSSINADYLKPINSTLSSSFFFSSTNINAFYRFRLNTGEKCSLAGKISLGTNLYSDWDQYRKYAWVGAGLEIGFGKFQLFK